MADPNPAEAAAYTPTYYDEAVGLKPQNPDTLNITNTWIYSNDYMESGEHCKNKFSFNDMLDEDDQKKIFNKTYKEDIYQSLLPRTTTIKQRSNM